MMTEVLLGFFGIFTVLLGATVGYLIGIYNILVDIKISLRQIDNRGNTHHPSTTKGGARL